MEKRQLGPQKVSDKSKHRDKGQMAMYNCDGWLEIWASPTDGRVFIRLRHRLCHDKYSCIDVPPDVQELVKNNPDKRPTEV